MLGEKQRSGSSGGGSVNSRTNKKTGLGANSGGLKGFFQENPRFTTLFRYCLYFFMLIVIALIGFYIWVYTLIPSQQDISSIKNYTSSEVYSSDGQVLGKYYLQDRKNVSLDQISNHVINALVATEDVRFYQHSGVDGKGLVRVFFKSLLMRDESSGGGSTITQQLVKNLFPRKNYGYFSMPVNKLKEAITAERLEDLYDKDEIMTFYLNTVPFGDNAFGIEVAAKRFFSKKAKDLNLEEAATLVGMLKANNTYNPRKYPDASKNRRNVVLDQMLKYGYIKKEVADVSKLKPMVVKYHYEDHNSGIATYFREYIRQMLQEWCSKNQKENGKPYNLYTDGLKIHTSIDLKMQKYAEESVESHMRSLQKSFYDHWGGKRPWGKNEAIVVDAMKRSHRYKTMKSAGRTDEEIKKAFNTPVDMKLFTWNGVQSKKLSPMDSIRHYLQFLHTGFLVMEPKSGLVKAWVGGINHEFFKYDHVNINTKRQVGSTFKPIVYASALIQGIEPCEAIPNDKATYPEYGNWSPGNADGKYGGSYSMQGALINSVNTVSAKLIMKAGIENVVELARAMGISSKLDPVPSLALGTADISLLEMVSAYACIASDGNVVKPQFVMRIEDSDGKVLADFTEPRTGQQAMNAYNAKLIRYMMEGVINQGTGQRLRGQYGLRLPIAGKTGTTQSHADGWFIGFTPDLVGGVWVGADDRRVHFRSIALGQGANMALPIWGQFMKKVVNDPKYAHMNKSQFSPLSETAKRQLDCIGYSEPDTTNIWYKLFGPPKSPQEREAERLQRQREREQRQQQYRRSPPPQQRRRQPPKEDPVEKFFDMFKKKKR